MTIGNYSTFWQVIMSNKIKSCNTWLFRFHDWSKWKVIETQVSNYGDYKILQARICLKCGLSQFKMIEK